MTRRLVRRLRGDSSGLALVEFALLLPVMLTLFLGGFQLCQASACQRRVTIAARALADLISQYDTITSTEVATILDASAQIMAPFSIASSQSRVSLIKVDAASKVTVMWSKGKNMAERPKGDFTGLPTNMKIPDSYYVLGEVTYNYNPMSGRFAYPVTFTQSLYMVPRKSTYVDCPTC